MCDFQVSISRPYRRVSNFFFQIRKPQNVLSQSLKSLQVIFLLVALAFTIGLHVAANRKAGRQSFLQIQFLVVFSLMFISAQILGLFTGMQIEYRRVSS